MRQTFLFAMTLLLGIALTGCSKDDSTEELDSKRIIEYKNLFTKEQIIGVWRSGEYWVSFAEDGFMSAYLSKECISEGDFIINRDTVKAESSEFYHYTDFVITNISDSTLECTVILDALDGSFHDKINDFTFTKTDENPCPKNHRLIGKKFQYDIDVVYASDFGTKRDTVPGVAYCTVSNYYLLKREAWSEKGRCAYDCADYYVYRPPLMYFRELYNINQYNQLKDKINIRKIEFVGDSIVVSNP